VVDLEHFASETGLNKDRLWHRGIPPSPPPQKEVLHLPRCMPTEAELSWEMFCQKEV